MDLGSLDFGTWRLVGMGLLSLGALATVVAIVAIIAMFRAGSVDYGRIAPATSRTKVEDDDFDDDDDAADEDDEDRDDEDQDDEDRTLDARREEVTAAARTVGGPTSLPSALSSPREDMFGVSATAAPRQTIQSTRDEPHVPSPDWYDYADVAEAKPAAEHGDDDANDDANTALGATPREDPPSPPSATPPPGTGPQQVVDPIDREPRRRSRWFEDAAASDDASPAVSEIRPDTPSATTAAPPVTFPWEQRAEPKSTTPERPVAPAREEPVRPTADRQDQRRPPPAEFEPTATSRPSEQRPTAPTPPERREPQRPAAGPEDTGRAAAVPSATPAKAAERQDPDAPTADWYDDPDGSGGERWWDGKGWTRHRRRRAGSSATTDTGRQRAVSAGPDADPPAAAIRRRGAPADADDARDGQATSRPPGWYRDPTGAGGRRFWDGSRWTDGS
jgi:hypothetical protein